MSHGTKLTKQKNLSSFFSMMAKVCGVFVRFGFSLKNETAPFFSVSELAQVCFFYWTSRLHVRSSLHRHARGKADPPRPLSLAVAHNMPFRRRGSQTLLSGPSTAPPIAMLTTTAVPKGAVHRATCHASMVS